MEKDGVSKPTSQVLLTLRVQVENDSDILLEAVKKREKRGKRSKGCSNSIFNCLRASARTFTEQNKRINFSEDVVFVQEEICEIEDKEAFSARLKKFPWISYRSDFNEINGHTSDSGWGCMIRTGQMMMAYTHIKVKLEEYKNSEVSSYHENLV